MKFANKLLEAYYNEIPQSNPIRWAILHREDGCLSYQSALFKCKDFFNEFVSKYHGFDFRVYNFDAGKMKINEEGLYVRVSGLIDFTMFLKNIRSINSLCEAKGYPPIIMYEVEDLKDDEAVLLIPRKYFDSTYSISWLTYFIRVSNVNMEITDWTKHPTKPVDNPFAKFFDKAWEQGVTPPIDSWFYAMKKNTTLKSPDSYTVHDNGVYNWFYFMELES